MPLYRAHERAIKLDELTRDLSELAIDYVSGHDVDASKYPPGERYEHVYKKAAARKAVYDAATEAKKASIAMEEANEALTAALRELRRFS